MGIQILDGNKLEVPEIDSSQILDTPIVRLPIDIREGGTQRELCLSEEDFSKHLLIVGGIGSGKTNLGVVSCYVEK